MINVRQKKTPSKTRTRSGFSLSELMVALGMFGLVSGGLLSFHVQMLKGGLFSEQKNRINRDVRAITTELNDVAKEANYFVMYESFASGDRNDEEDRLYSNRTGDFVVFVFTSPIAATFGTQPVNRLAGYFRSPRDLDDVGNVGPVLKFDLTFSSPVDISDSSSTKLEDLIPSASGTTDFEEIVELSKGLANGKLFYNFEKKSIMVNGQIYHGLSGNRITDTYNFTVSPRG